MYCRISGRPALVSLRRSCCTRPSGTIFALALTLSSTLGSAAPLPSKAPPRAPELQTPLDAGDEYLASISTLNCDNAAQTFMAAKPLLPILSDLIEKASTENPPKAEFETTPQYNFRSNRYWTWGLGGVSRIVFVDWLDRSSIRYDADQSQIIVSDLVRVDLSNHRDEDLMSHSLIKLISTSADNAGYVAQNAFGVRVKVTSSTDTAMQLRFPRSQFAHDDPGMQGKITIPATVDQARQFMAHPVAVIVADIIPPYFENFDSFLKATIDSPFEMQIHELNLSVQMRCVVFPVGDQAIGKMLFKY